jgi:hypothetical protein
MVVIPDGAGVAFLVSAAVVYDIVAATNSSPQTTEINAAARSDTLMKWVKIGMYQAVAFIVAAAVFDKQRWAILAGGLTAAVLLWLQYVHAHNSGVKSSLPGTESYGR